MYLVLLVEKVVADFRVQEDTVDNALKALEDRGIKQPMLLIVSVQYYIKTDNTAIPLPCCSCFIEALEFLFMILFVFSVHYPSESRFFYGFIEKILGITPSVKSSTVTDLMRQLNVLAGSRRNTVAEVNKRIFSSSVIPTSLALLFFFLVCGEHVDQTATFKSLYPDLRLLNLELYY